MRRGAAVAARFSAVAQQTTKALLAAAAIAALVLTGHVYAAGAVLLIAALDLHLMLAWLLAAVTVLGAALLLLLAFVPFLPLQWLPAPRMSRAPLSAIDKARYWAVALIGAVLLVWFVLPVAPFFAQLVFGALSLVLMRWLVTQSLAVREYAMKFVVSSMLLPAITVATSAIPLTNGRKAKAPDLLRELRAAAFALAPRQHHHGQKHAAGALWTNATIPGDGDVSIDAALWRHPAQQDRAPASQLWLLWFPANGEVYELCLPEYHDLAATLGVNIMVFNYRGVSQSRGALQQSGDLVTDGRLVLGYMMASLGAAPEHVLFFGRSLGGAVSALVRAEQPGPIVNDRSFRSLPCAAQSVVSLMLKHFTKNRIWLPLVLVRGIASAIVSIDELDVTHTWAKLTAPKLLIFHRKDEMIDYDHASLHQALQHSFPSQMGDAIELDGDDEPGADHHNNPLAVCRCDFVST